jgi:hypothetical protein
MLWLLIVTFSNILAISGLPDMGESFPDWVLSGRFCDSCKSVEKFFMGGEV